LPLLTGDKGLSLKFQKGKSVNQLSSTRLLTKLKQYNTTHFNMVMDRKQVLLDYLFVQFTILPITTKTKSLNFH
jgi:hypothetical protein